MPDIDDRLHELERLKLKGAITEDEYQGRRKAVLDLITAPLETARPKGKFGCLGALAVVIVVAAVLAIIGGTVGGNSGKTITSTTVSTPIGHTWNTATVPAEVCAEMRGISIERAEYLYAIPPDDPEGKREVDEVWHQCNP